MNVNVALDNKKGMKPCKNQKQESIKNANKIKPHSVFHLSFIFAKNMIKLVNFTLQTASTQPPNMHVASTDAY